MPEMLKELAFTQEEIDELNRSREMPITFDEEWLLWCRRGLAEANMRYMLHKQWCAQLDLHEQEADHA